MKTLMRYIRPKFKSMSLQLSIKLMATIVELLLPSLLKYLIDDVAPLNQVNQMYLWGGLMVLCAAGALLGNVIANRMATRISRGITESLRHDLFARIETLSCRQTDAFTVPTLISRLTSDTYNVHQMVDRMQRLGVRAPIMLIGGIIMTLFIDPVLTLVLVAVLPMLAFVVITVTRKGVPLYTLVQQAVDGLVRKVQEFMTGIRVVKALSKTEYEKEHFDIISGEVVKRDQHASMVMAITNPVMNLLLNIGLTTVIVVGAFRVNAGIMKAGTIIAFLNYFTIILTALMMVTRMFVMYSKGSASARRIEEVLNAPDDMSVKPETALRNEQYHILFDDVCFSYNKKRDNISHVSFALKRGETLGVIGATGSGKSTLIWLLMRFYDADSGEIRIGGRRVDEIAPERLRAMFGVAFQNDFLMADSIRANIDFERGLSDADIDRAVRDAQADFIHSDKQGLQDDLTVKGTNLSGGQKQRLLIARALAGQPEILILDDASSALDYKTDAQLRRALSGYENTTKVIIAQRVSSVQGANLILVLDDGRVLGSGTHEQLLASCESYREIYDAQMGDER